MLWLLSLVAVQNLLQLPLQQRARQDILFLPRALQRREALVLAVTLGGKHTEEITVRDANGRLIGVISPFALRQKPAGATYLVPIPADAISHGRVIVRFSIEHEGQRSLAPRPGQLRTVKLRIKSATFQDAP